jgi:hypothetical protein
LISRDTREKPTSTIFIASFNSNFFPFIITPPRRGRPPTQTYVLLRNSRSISILFPLFQPFWTAQISFFHFPFAIFTLTIPTSILGDIERAIRQLEQERTRLQQQEKKTVMEMKKIAKENNPKALKIMARDIIRIRKHGEKFIDLIVKMRGMFPIFSTHFRHFICFALHPSSTHLLILFHHYLFPLIQSFALDMTQY